jgi:hypothetical protein
VGLQPDAVDARARGLDELDDPDGARRLGRAGLEVVVVVIQLRVGIGGGGGFETDGEV